MTLVGFVLFYLIRNLECFVSVKYTLHLSIHHFEEAHTEDLMQRDKCRHLEFHSCYA